MHITSPFLLLVLALVSVHGYGYDGAGEVLVQGPVALMAAGPQAVRLNTTLATLVALDGTMADFCDPASPELDPTKVGGKVVIVKLLQGACSWEKAYVNLVDAGSQAILLRAPDHAVFAPGHFGGSVGRDMLANLEATRLNVPMLQISDDTWDALKRLLHHNPQATSKLAEPTDNQQATHRPLIIESSTNEHVTLYNSSAWLVVMKRIVPFVHSAVVATSGYLLIQQASRGEFQWGSTSCWIAFIEMIPAAILGLASLCGIFDGTFFARESQSFFMSHYMLSGAVSTVLAARHWNAQAAFTAAKVGVENVAAAAEDPQQSWKSVVCCVAVLGLDLGYSFYVSLNGNASVSWFSYALCSLVVTAACGVFLIHAMLKTPNAARKRTSAPWRIGFLPPLIYLPSCIFLPSYIFLCASFFRPLYMFLPSYIFFPFRPSYNFRPSHIFLPSFNISSFLFVSPFISFLHIVIFSSFESAFLGLGFLPGVPSDCPLHWYLPFLDIFP
jgi:hypothetical protein